MLITLLVSLKKAARPQKMKEGTYKMVFEKLKSILKEQFDVEESNITLETNLFTDLEADSLDLADLLTSVEDEFEIDIEADEDIAGSINTVGDIVNYISEIKGIS